MGTYNQIATRLVCPRCHNEAMMEIDLYFGLKDQIIYHLGDKYEWTASPATENGGRPLNGDLDGEGYTECPVCGKDFFVVVAVRNDILTDVVPDSTKKPMIPD